MGDKMENLKSQEKGRKKMDFTLSMKDQDRNGPGEGTVYLWIGCFQERMGLTWAFQEWHLRPGSF